MKTMTIHALTTEELIALDCDAIEIETTLSVLKDYLENNNLVTPEKKLKVATMRLESALDAIRKMKKVWVSDLESELHK